MPESYNLLHRYPVVIYNANGVCYDVQPNKAGCHISNIGARMLPRLAQRIYRSPIAAPLLLLPLFSIALPAALIIVATTQGIFHVIAAIACMIASVLTGFVLCRRVVKLIDDVRAGVIADLRRIDAAMPQPVAPAAREIGQATSVPAQD